MKLASSLESAEVSNQDPDPESERQQLKTILQETTAEVAGIASRKNKDWFDDNDAEIQDLLQKKRSWPGKLLACPDDRATRATYRSACSTLQTKLREMKNNNWWLELAERTQLYQGDPQISM